MSTDITIESTAVRQQLDFLTFVQTAGLELGQALAVVAQSETLAAGVLQDVLTEVRHNWTSNGSVEAVERDVFERSVARVHATATDSVTHHDQLRHRAYLVAHHGLGWPLADVATTFDVEVPVLMSLLESPGEHFPETDKDQNLSTRIAHTVRGVEIAPPDGATINQAFHAGQRRTRRVRVGAVVAAALVVLVLIGSLIGRSDSEFAVAPASSIRNEPASVGDTLSPEEELSIRLSNPDVIAPDGDGGFVGVKVLFEESQAVFAISDDGFNDWIETSRWDLEPNTIVGRLERSGDHFVAWLGDLQPTPDALVTTIGVSDDLQDWTLLDLPIADDGPRGLTYNRTVKDVSVSGSNVLALVTTEVEIDFSDLPVVEGYTCGETILPRAVRVNLCNDKELDVLSLSDTYLLPDRNRFFISRDGRPFEQTGAPFASNVAITLRNAGDKFAVADESGVHFATSDDAIWWEKLIGGKPQLPVRAAATSPTNSVVGIGDLDGEPVAFVRSSNTYVTTPLAAIVGEVSPGVDAIVSYGGGHWVVYLYEPNSAWLLTTEDGLVWTSQETQAPVEGLPPRILVGDDEAILEWRYDGGGGLLLGTSLG